MKELTRKQFQESVENDPYNLKQLRNRRNTPRESYNCGGFALSVYNWICPYTRTDNESDEAYYEDGEYTEDEREYLINTWLEEGWDISEIEEEILQRDVDYLLDKYPFLAPADISDYDNNGVLIAYRLFITADEHYDMLIDTDFHFKLCINGFWFEKLGTDPVLPCSFEPEKPWVASCSDVGYRSRIAYFTIDEKYLDTMKKEV